MDIIERIKQEAKQANRTILLPEGDEERNIQAAAQIRKEGLAQVVLLGAKDAIHATAARIGVSIDDFPIVDPADDPRRQEFADTFFEMRRAKGVTAEQAWKTMGDPLFFASMMVKKGQADGYVSGAIHATADVLRPALTIVRPAPGVKTVSSCFLMVVPDKSYGENGLFCFGDAAVVPDPDAEQLADIALETAETFRALVGAEPRVAMLSFSTKGSAKHPNVDKVAQATEIARQRNPKLLIDGELQADASIVPSVAHTKVKGESPVAGRANVLIFPDLGAGNIGYKLVERLAKASAYGPLIQGLNRPVNDLSRGCSANDIVNIVAITSLQAVAAAKR